MRMHTGHSTRVGAAAGPMTGAMRLLVGLAACGLALRADLIVLKNGDRATGSVVKKDAAALTFKSAHFGTITLPWEQVESITTESPLHAELADGQNVQGRLTTANGRVRFGTRSVAPADVKVLRDDIEQAAYERLLHPGWGQRWAGTATLGWAGTAGNAQTNTLSAGMNAARATNTDRTTMYFNAVKASALLNGVKSGAAQAERGGAGDSRNLAKRLFFSGFNDWEYDRFQALDLRVTLGGGLGFHAWKGERGRLELPFGLAWSHSAFDPAPSPKFTRNAAEAYWGDDLTFKLSNRTSLTQSCRMFNNLSDTGQYRANFDVGASTQIFKGLSWNVSFSDRYLSNPASGRKTNDLLYTTGVGINFAR